MTTYPIGGFCSRCACYPCRCYSYNSHPPAFTVQYDPMILQSLMRIEGLLSELIDAVGESTSSASVQTEDVK